MPAARFVHQQGSVARHADQNVPGTLLLQGAGCGGDLGVAGQFPAHQFAQFVIVGLDEEGMKGQDVGQQGAGGVHNAAHALAVQPGQQPLVGVLRHTGRDAAREDEYIVFGQRIELFFQLLQGRRRDDGARAVQLGLFTGLDLHVDAGHAVVEVDEVGAQPLCGQPAFQPRAGLARHKAQRHALAAQLPEHTGHIDAFAAQHAVFADGAVHLADFQRLVQTDDIINGRVEGYSVDHNSVSFIKVNSRYLGLGQRLVRMAPLCRSVMTAG